MPRACPCFSGLFYAACCADHHAGAREAETPEALMRSRYSAFALGRGEYLVHTLAHDHPDRELPRAELVRELSRAKDRQRFLGLRILFAEERGDEGEVLFFARIFERGADRSFAELSTFVREAGAWKYVSGVAVTKDALPDDVDSLTREAFLALR